MKLFITSVLWLIFIVSSPAFAWKWLDLWQTADQQGIKLLQNGKPKEASQTFKNVKWQAVANYRAKDFKTAFLQFSQKNTSDSQYNAGNAAAFLGKYEDALKAYDKAIALNANNSDAVTNRDIIKKLMENKNQQQSSSQQNKTDKFNNSNKNNNEHSQEQNQNSQDKPKDSNPSQTNLKTEEEQGLPDQKDEGKKQLMRRLTDDPGGLLQQKFMRDYYRRHASLDEES